MKQISRCELKNIVVISVFGWGVMSLIFAISPHLFNLRPEYARQVSAVTPLHCLTLGLLPLAIVIPATIGTFTRKRLFPLYLAVWAGLITTTLSFGFGLAAGLGGRCDPVFIAGGIFAFLTVCGDWLLDTARKRRRGVSRLSSVWSDHTTDTGLPSANPRSCT